MKMIRQIFSITVDSPLGVSPEEIQKYLHALIANYGQFDNKVNVIETDSGVVDE